MFVRVLAGLLLAVALVSAATAVRPPVAGAGTYADRYDFSRAATGIAGWGPLVSTPWFTQAFTPGQGLSIVATGNGGALYPSTGGSKWEWQAPAGASIGRVELSGLSGAYQDGLRARAQLDPASMVPPATDGVGVDTSWGHTLVRPGDVWANQSYTLTPPAATTAHRFWLWQYPRSCDASGTPDYCQAVTLPATPLKLGKVDVTVEDPTPPAADLAAPGLPADGEWTNAATTKVDVSASDPQSGIASLVLHARGPGGGSFPIARNRPDANNTTPRAPGTPPLPTTASGERTVRLPKQGKVVVTVTATNGAGMSTTSPPRTVNVDRELPTVTWPKKLIAGQVVTVRQARSGLADVRITVTRRDPNTQVEETRELPGNACPDGRKSCSRIAQAGTVTVTAYSRAGASGDRASGGISASRYFGTTTDPIRKNGLPKITRANVCKKGLAANTCKTLLVKARREAKKHQKTWLKAVKKAKALARASTRQVAPTVACEEVTLALAGAGIFAMGNRCTGDKATNGDIFTGTCQNKVTNRKRCLYAVQKITLRHAGSYCAIVPLDRKLNANPDDPGTNNRPALYIPKSNPCNQKVHEECRKAFDAKNGFPAFSTRMLTELKLLQRCADPYYEIPVGAIARTVDPGKASAHNVDLDVDYVNAHPNPQTGGPGVQVCAEVNPQDVAANKEPPADDKPNVICPDVIAAPRSDGAYRIKWRWMTNDGRYVMANAGNGVVALGQSHWFFIPIQAILGKDAPAGATQEQTAKLRGDALCAKFLKHTPGADESRSAAHHKTIEHWGNVMVCGKALLKGKTR